MSISQFTPVLNQLAIQFHDLVLCSYILPVTNELFCPHQQIELLRAHKIPVAGVIGHSFGEHAAAFASGCLTRHEFILSALARGSHP